jgi:hypothetical protein
MRTLALFALALASLTAGCGGPEISHDDLTRDDAALRAHEYHETLVQLAGDVESSPDPSVPGACDAPCANHARITDLANRICETAHHDDHDEAGQFLCDDSREREMSSTRRYQACHCAEAAATTAEPAPSSSDAPTS